MANNLFQSFIDTAKTIAGYPITVANGVFMRNGKTLDETEEEINTILGTTDISKYGDGTVTGGLSMLSNNAYDLKMLGWTVPKECPVQNYVDEYGVFHQIVGRVDLSKLMWEWADTLNEFRTDLYIMGMNPHSTNIYCSKYQFGSEMYISGMGIYIKDPNYDSSTISQFKADNKGVYFYYELATEITKPIDGNEAIKLLNDKLGNTDISAIGDGTVTGGLNALNSNLVWKFHHNYNGSETAQLPEDYTEIYLLFGMDSDSTRLPMIIPRIALSPTAHTQYKTSSVSVESESLGICFVVTQKNATLAWVYKNYNEQDRSMYWFDIYYR